MIDEPQLKFLAYVATAVPALAFFVLLGAALAFRARRGLRGGVVLLVLIAFIAILGLLSSVLDPSFFIYWYAFSRSQ